MTVTEYKAQFPGNETRCQSLIKAQKIIEFDGTYWHNEQVANPTGEKERDEQILFSGYMLLHVSEFEYKKNREKVLEECIKFRIQ